MGRKIDNRMDVASFDEMDANDDGVIDREEYERALPAGRLPLRGQATVILKNLSFPPEPFITMPHYRRRRFCTKSWNGKRSSVHK